MATIGAGVMWYGPSGSVLPSHDVVADLNVMNTTLIVDSPGTYTCRAMWGVLMLSTSVTVTAGEAVGGGVGEEGNLFNFRCKVR